MQKLSTAELFKTNLSAGGVTLSDEELAKVQRLLLSMLSDITRYCEAEGLTYCLGGGSALGAVRHGGFIPWDDDLDIDMPRRDYERFLIGFQEQYKDRYDVRIPGFSAGHALLFAQIRLKGTCLRTRDDLAGKACGLPVDIFPVENTYASPLSRRFHGLGCMAYGYLVSCRKFFRDRGQLKKILPKNAPRLPFRIKTAVGCLLSFRSVERWVRRADQWNARCADHDSRYVSVPSGRRHFFGELCRRDEWFEGTEAVFEGLPVMIPRLTDAYLTRMYGDYRKLPPEDARERHVYYPPLVLDGMPEASAAASKEP